MINYKYNPDVLTCLSNLSSDEIFTPPKLVNQMLDLLPKNIWNNKNIKFLDPCSKSGVFLREIVKRLDIGLEKEISDKQERIQHILTNQIYGMCITEITSLISRRTVYCSKNALSKNSICNKFNNNEGNLLFIETDHNWVNNKCKKCGANFNEYDLNRNSLEKHAYSFIHLEDMKEVFGDMKFDVIIGNPPYQISDGGGTGDSAKPIYNKFIEQAISLKPKYITMIIPSRWMKGGKGLDNFRKEMINDHRLKYIYDFENAKECFPGVNIDGGVQYFLWDKNHNGKVSYVYKSIDGEEISTERYLNDGITDVVIRDFRQLSIIEKVFKENEKKFSEIVSSRNPYGISSDFFNNENKYKNFKTSNTEKKGYKKIYGVLGKKGGTKRVSKYIEYNSKINNNYKLFFSKAYMTTSTVPPEIIVGEKNDICTETFLEIGSFKTYEECINCLEYIKTKFFRALLFYKRHSLNISKDSFSLIPMQDFTKKWTDDKLYKKYNLSNDDIKLIEENIKEM